jgi:peptidyl-prolyl cis-trans isomerase D
LKAFYDANLASFKTQEQADVQYVVLDLPTIERQISLNPADVQSYYEQNASRLAGGEERRASHVLLTLDAGASAEDKAKIRSKADELLAQVRANPERFADIARAHSQDPGSAANGGDLDFFARGAMVKPFEDAAFALQKGDISQIVESDFGYHIILLTDIKQAQVPSFESMRPQLEADLRKQQAQRQFAELAETFSNSVYEQSDSLSPVAERLKLSVQKAASLTRTPTTAVQGVLNNPKLLQAIFSEDAIAKRRNTAAVEVAPNTLVSARVVNHRPSAVRPFEEVKADVRQRLIQAKSAELAKAEGQARLAAWTSDLAQSALGEAVTVSRDQAPALPQAVIDATLRADPSKMPALIGVDLGLQGFAVVRVNKIVQRPEATAQQSEQSRQQFARLWGQAESQAYLSSLKSQFKVEMLAEKPKKLDESQSQKP